MPVDSQKVCSGKVNRDTAEKAVSESKNLVVQWMEMSPEGKVDFVWLH
jgi:hypothetical protein